MSILQAILIGTFYGWSKETPIGNFMMLRHGAIDGLVVGIIMGDPIQGMIIGATINMLFVGLINVGLVGPSDPQVATFIGVGVALAAGLSAEQAIPLAVAFGLFGNVISMLEMVVPIPFYEKVAGAVKKANFKSMHFWYWAGAFARLATQTAIIGSACYLSQGAVSGIMEMLPRWADAGFKTIGNLLPAVGISLGLFGIIKSKDPMLAFFVIAFFAVKLLGLSVLGICIFTVMLICILIAQDVANAKKAGKKFNFNFDEGAEKQHILSVKQVKNACLRFLLFYRGVQNYHTYSAPGYIMGIYPIIKALYPNNPEKQSQEMVKYDMYFQTTPSFNGIIMGAIIAMEEERAISNTVPVEAITSLKSGLMGPVAGIADPIYQGVYRTLLATISISLAIEPVPKPLNKQLEIL